jgi:hypothetical protein
MYSKDGANCAEGHRANIMAKFNRHSRTELVKYAIRKGLIDVADKSNERGGAINQFRRAVMLARFCLYA